METNRKLTLFVAYYLARFNEEAYRNLGLGNQGETHSEIARIMTVKPSTVKNWRDEFDPMFEHRAGWHQRSMSITRVRVAEALEGLDEPSIRALALGILSKGIQEEPFQEQQLISVVSKNPKNKSEVQFTSRAQTGRAAEEFFIEHFENNREPTSGNLIDCRELGCGYDFRIEAGKLSYFVEVKGLSQMDGGIVFTSKEWNTAKEARDRYFLCVVRNLSSKAFLTFIADPASKFDPKMNIQTVIQVNWMVTQNQLGALDD